MITKKVTYLSDEGFEFMFEPIEDTLKIIKTKTGFSARYLIQDQDYELPDKDDDEVFLVNYHRDFFVTRDSIITKDEVANWYKGEKISQQKDYHIFILSSYIHSGVSLSLGYNKGDSYTFWDTSHIGVVLISKKLAKTKEKATKFAQSLIDTYNQGLSGDVYCLVKETYNKDKEQIDYDTLGGCYDYQEALKCLETEI